MKHIKLFEAYIRKIRFDIPPLFVIPNGVSRDKMYLINVETGDGDITTFLADYALIEEIYDVMTLRRIRDAFGAYIMMKRNQHIDRSLDSEWQKASRDGVETFMRTSMESGFDYDNIMILASSPKFGPPVDVWIGSANEPGMLKSIKAMIKQREAECKECGDASSCSIVPGDENDGSSDDKTVYFDKDRAGNMTDVVFDKNSTYEEFMNWYWDNLGESYYLQFPKIGTCVIFPHAANEYSISEVTGGKLFCDAKQILYRCILQDNFDTFNLFTDAHDFLLTNDEVDEIMGTLVDRGVSMRIINAIKRSTPKHREQNPQEGEVKYEKFIKYSTDSKKYYVQEYLDASAKYNYYGKTREDYKKELEDSLIKNADKQTDFVNNPVTIPISIADDVMAKLPRTQSEFNNMIDRTPKSELDKCAAMQIDSAPLDTDSYGKGKDRNDSYIDEISRSIKVRPFFPKSDPVEGRGKKDPGVFKGVTSEMIRKATVFQVYCMCYYDVNILK